MASAEEVYALKRELEQLKQLLGQERRGDLSSLDLLASRPGALSSTSSPTRAQQQQQQDQYFSDARTFDEDGRRETSPHRPMTTASSSSPSSPQRVKSVRWKESPVPTQQQQQQQHQQQQQQRQPMSQNGYYTQFVPIDSKRGKWWLKDRQILSRNVPAPSDQTIAMKVRETWQWSGRSVVVDKIITCRRPRDDDEGEEHHSFYQERDTSDRRSGRDDHHDQSPRYREELTRMGSKKSLAGSAQFPPASVVAAQSAFQDSKQLAQEFMQRPKSAGSSAVDELSGRMRTASQRMDAEMAKAAVAVEMATTEKKDATPTNGGGGFTARIDDKAESPSRPQTSPSKTMADASV